MWKIQVLKGRVQFKAWSKCLDVWVWEAEGSLFLQGSKSTEAEG